MKSKKLLLGSLSVMALVATPIAAVVSCSKGDDKVLKSTAKGFLLGGLYIPEALASKAGSVKMDAGDKTVTYTWDKALKAGEKAKLKVGEKDATDIEIKVAAADHFVLPIKGKSGVGIYLTKDEVKARFKLELNDGNLNLDPKVEGDKVTEIGINDINAFLKEAGVEVKSATAKKIAKDKYRPEHYEFTIVWK